VLHRSPGIRARNRGALEIQETSADPEFRYLEGVQFSDRGSTCIEVLTPTPYSKDMPIRRNAVSLLASLPALLRTTGAGPQLKPQEAKPSTAPAPRPTPPPGTSPAYRVRYAQPATGFGQGLAIRPRFAGKCRVRASLPKIVMVDGTPAKATNLEESLIEFDTRAGGVYEVTRKG
jgi:hypothetical protein